MLTYSRAVSLRRLLLSLSQADFGGDVVDLEIWIDAPRQGDGSSSLDSVVQVRGLAGVRARRMLDTVDKT